jgi:AcrR family transcriptional regulator
MGRKAGLTLDAVVDAAQTVADENGLDSLTLVAVADRLGIKPPSLYNHVGGLEGLRRELAIRGARRTAELIGSLRSGQGDEQAVRAIAQAYRRFALDHPGLYEATVEISSLIDDAEVWPEMQAAIEDLEAVLDDMGIPPPRRVGAIRSIRSTIHGFVTLERTGGFGLPEDSDESFVTVLDLLIAGLRALADEDPRPRGASVT